MTNYENWTTEELINEVYMYQKHYKEFGSTQIKYILVQLKSELSKRKINL